MQGYTRKASDDSIDERSSQRQRTSNNKEDEDLLALVAIVGSEVSVNAGEDANDDYTIADQLVHVLIATAKWRWVHDDAVAETETTAANLTNYYFVAPGVDASNRMLEGEFQNAFATPVEQSVYQQYVKDGQTLDHIIARARCATDKYIKYKDKHKNQNKKNDGDHVPAEQLRDANAKDVPPLSVTFASAAKILSIPERLELLEKEALPKNKRVPADAADPNGAMPARFQAIESMYGIVPPEGASYKERIVVLEREILGIKE